MWLVQLFGSVGLWLVSKLGRGISHYSSTWQQNYFYPVLRTVKTMTLDFWVIVQQVLAPCPYFLHILFSMVFIFYFCFVFKYIDSFLCFHHWLLRSFVEILCYYNYFFYFKIPIQFFSGVIPDITWRILVGLKWSLY